MTQEMDVDSVVRLRIRGLRKAKGWSLESLATRAQMSVSTLSRLETGNRRMALDQLVPLAQALDTTLDELVAPPAEQDALIRPEPVSVPGLTTWRLSEPDGLHGPWSSRCASTREKAAVNLNHAFTRARTGSRCCAAK